MSFVHENFPKPSHRRFAHPRLSDASSIIAHGASQYCPGVVNNFSALDVSPINTAWPTWLLAVRECTRIGVQPPPFSWVATTNPTLRQKHFTIGSAALCQSTRSKLWRLANHHPVCNLLLPSPCRPLLNCQTALHPSLWQFNGLSVLSCAPAWLLGSLIVHFRPSRRSNTLHHDYDPIRPLFVFKAAMWPSPRFFKTDLRGKHLFKHNAKMHRRLQVLFPLMPHQLRLRSTNYRVKHTPPFGTAPESTDPSKSVQNDVRLNYSRVYCPQLLTFAAVTSLPSGLRFHVLATSQVHRHRLYRLDMTSPLTPFPGNLSRTNQPNNKTCPNCDSILERIMHSRPKWRCINYLWHLWDAFRESLPWLMEHCHTLRKHWFIRSAAATRPKWSLCKQPALVCVSWFCRQQRHEDVFCPKKKKPWINLYKLRLPKQRWTRELRAPGKANDHGTVHALF